MLCLLLYSCHNTNLAISLPPFLLCISNLTTFGQLFEDRRPSFVTNKILRLSAKSLDNRGILFTVLQYSVNAFVSTCVVR